MNETGRRVRVVIADAHAGLLDAMSRLLMSRCDVVQTVTDGMALLRAQSRFRPDVVVVDVMLPGVNGVEATRRIRTATPRTRVILISDTDDADLRNRGHAAGASQFILKMRLASDLLPAVVAGLEEQRRDANEAPSPQEGEKHQKDRERQRD